MSSNALLRSTRRIAAVVVWFLAATTLIAAPAEAGAPCDHPSQAAEEVATFAADRHPLVFVHGWTGKGKELQRSWDAINARMPKTFQARFFDYSNANTEWAASPRVASCLAAYLRAVSKAHHDAGGDGRVFVVAHSMGGLATRFATSQAYTDHPATADLLAGLTTIDTPHLGSPFGNTPEGAVWQWINELKDPDLLPDRNSDALRCLAPHNRTTSLPSGCDLPPYLPSGVPLGQISGDNVVRRTLFGMPLYDIDLRSDGVVGVDSATGYLPQSGPPGASAPRMSNAYVQDVSCTVTTDETMSLLRSFRGGNVPAAIIQAELQAISFLSNDSAVLDQINNGQPGPQLSVMLLVATLVYPCSHGAMRYNPDSIDAVVQSLRDQLRSTPQPKITVLRPFDRAGKLAAGWALDDRTTGTIDCRFASPSPSAVDPGIQECAPVAAEADSCLITPQATTAFCLENPFAPTIVRNAITGQTHTDSPATEFPVPIGIILDDGTTCRRRIGGSWPTTDAKPDYVGYYNCSQGAKFRAVWGPPDGNGITKTESGWIVETGGEHGSLTTHKITEALFVGVA
ncbi:esterase/lipase family protein [Nocardia nova]|nr:alpha/beta hydrolase [Nocardia nova]